MFGQTPSVTSKLKSLIFSSTSLTKFSLLDLEAYFFCLSRKKMVPSLDAMTFRWILLSITMLLSSVKPGDLKVRLQVLKSDNDSHDVQSNRVRFLEEVVDVYKLYFKGFIMARWSLPSLVHERELRMCVNRPVQWMLHLQLYELLLPMRYNKNFLCNGKYIFPTNFPMMSLFDPMSIPK